MQRQTGFTLVEILVAVTVTSLLLTTIYGVFTTTSEAKQKVEERAAAGHLGRVLFTRIGREILGLSLAVNPQKSILSGGRNDRGEEYLEILSNAGNGRQAGLVRIRYRLVKGEADDEEAGLWRDSGPAYQDPEELTSERISGGIESFGLKFHDGGAWRDSWDSGRDGVPKLIEVSLKLRLGTDGIPLHTIFQPPRSGVQ